MAHKNEVLLRGWVHAPFELHHITDGVKVYSTVIRTKRWSGKKDLIPVYITEKHLRFLRREPKENDFVEVRGHYHSRNTYDEDKNRLVNMYVQAKRISYSDPEKHPSENYIHLSGYVELVKEEKLSSNGRRFTQFLVSVIRYPNRRSCITCIAWGRDRFIIAGKERGDFIEITGRIESRRFLKYKNGERVNELGYEVCITKFMSEES